MNETLFDRHEEFYWHLLNRTVIGGETEVYIQNFHKNLVKRYRETVKLRQDLAARRLDLESARQGFNILLRCFEGLLGESHLHYWLARAYAEQYPEKSTNRFFVSFHFCALDAAWHFLDVKNIDDWKDVSVLNALRKPELLPWKVGIEELALVADRNEDGLPELDDKYLSELQSEMKLACELFGVRPKDQQQLSATQGEQEQESEAKKSEKRNSTPGSADAKILATLCVHHGYEDRSCKNMDPIVGNRLAKMADVSPGSVSSFWKRRFRADGHEGSYEDYRRACGNDTLPLRLALWSGEAPIEDAIQLMEERIALRWKGDDD